MKLNHVVDMIRGRKGTLVHLVIQPAGAGDAVHKDIVLKRDVVSIKDSLAKADIIEHKLPGGGIEKIGVIDLHDFYNNTENDHSAATTGQAHPAPEEGERRRASSSTCATTAAACSTRRST